MRLLLDEMYPRRIAQELRARGHDVMSVHDSPGSGTPDQAVFDYACEQQRTLVTENIRDFRPLAEAHIAGGGSHYGLVLATSRRWPRHDRGALIAALDRLLRTTPDQPISQEIWLQ